MAEILGAVASGISIAHLATKIIVTGIKTADLLKEMRDVPKDIQFRLQQLQTLALNLQHSESIVGSESTPALAAARTQCQRCLVESKDVLDDFNHQIEKAKGFRRNATLFRILLSRDVLSRVEKRLSACIDMLSQAQQVHMMHLLVYQGARLEALRIEMQRATQTSQAPQLMSFKSTEERCCLPTWDDNSGFPDSAGALSNATRTHMNTPSRCPSSMTFGIERLIGLVQVEVCEVSSKPCVTGQVSSASATSAETQGRTHGMTQLCIRVKPPRWFSQCVIEFNITAQLHAYGSGWKRLFTTANIALEDDFDLFEELKGYTVSGDVHALTKCLDERSIIRLAEYCHADELLFKAMGHLQWASANCLLDRGAKPIHTEEWCWTSYPEFPPIMSSIHGIGLLEPWWHETGDGSHLLELKRLILREHNDNILSAVLLRHYEGSGESFNYFRQSIWPDDEYYSSEFLVERMRVAISLAFGARKTPTHAAEMIRHALSGGTQLKPELDLRISDDSGSTLLHCLAEAAGFLEGRAPMDEWHALIRYVLSEAGSVKTELHTLARSRGPYFETPLLRLIQGSISSHGVLPKDARTPKHRLPCCSTAMTRWLEDLEACGVDLVSYGREEQLFLAQSTSKQDFLVVLDNDGREEPLHLIALNSGLDPRKWRLYWSEVSDLFAGQFWALVETDEDQANTMTLNVPGAWVQDASEDDGF